MLAVRATLERDGGALVHVTHGGFIDPGGVGPEEFLSGKLPPNGIGIRTQPRMHTSHPDCLWLNRRCCVGIGQAHLDRLEAEYGVFAVRWRRLRSFRRRPPRESRQPRPPQRRGSG
jgi:hypothetical protein